MCFPLATSDANWCQPKLFAEWPQFKATLQCGCIQIPYILRIKIAWTDKRPKLVVGEKLDNDSVIPSDWLACV